MSFDRPNLYARLDALTSLRFFAAFIVVIFHMSDYSLETLRKGPLEKGRLAVDLFFILSGFILAHVYGAAFARNDCSTGRFFVARLGRIYPAHFAMMIVFLAYVLIMGSMGFSYNVERYRADSFIWHLTLLDAWGLDRGLSWNIPAWSISAEFAAYLLFPFIIRPIMRLSPHTAMWLLLMTVGAFAAVNEPFNLTERTYNFSVARVLPEFLIGVLAYRSHEYLLGRVGKVNIAFVLAVSFLIWAVWVGMPDAIIVTDLVVLVVLGAAVTGTLAKALAWRPLLYLGETSYSLYIVHAFVLSVAYGAFKSPRLGTFVPSAIRDLLVVLAVLLAASLLYHFVEAPSRHVVRRALANGSVGAAWGRARATKV
jgi:peptidoglycan/LPS O-acetylase OafA/YrhL